MSNTQEKPILQRAVGAIFLLALIALVAILLLQPTDKLPESTAKHSKPQQPTISITANNKASNAAGTNNKAPEIILESTTSTTQISNNTENTPVEVISEDIWQSVEQQAPKAVEPPKPILIASAESKTTPKTATEKPKTTQPAKTNTTTASPKTEATKPKVTTPKLELIADSEKSTAKPAVQAAPSNKQGKWYVQIGAFGNAANAQKLVNQYKQQGYTVRIQKDNNLNRVQIGPFTTKKDAEKVQAKTKTQSINPAVIHLP